MLPDVSPSFRPPFPGALIPSWRSDLDPNALPPTPALTLGQRRVLSACLQQFSSKGFVASSMREIAASIGMQSPSLYNHFPSKEAMLSALVLLGYEHHHGRILAALVAAGPTPTEQLSAIVREHILISCHFAGLTLVTDRELAHLPSESLAAVLGYRAQSSVLVAQVLRRGHETGAFRVVHEEATISTLAGMGQYAAGNFPYFPEMQAEQLASEYVDLALRLVSPSSQEEVLS